MSIIATASLLREPAPRRHEEETLCRSVARFLDLALPRNAAYTHIPLGGLRSRLVGQRLTGMGTHAGWPDYILVYAGRPIGIEMKTPQGALSVVQRHMHDHLRLCGMDVLVCRTPEGVACALRELGVPLKATVSA